MMTQTHLLVGAAIFTAPGQVARNIAAIAGSIAPDAALYTLFSWSRMQGVSMETIFRQLYWSPSWQAAMSPGNSAPLYLLILAIGYAVYRLRPDWRYAGTVIMVFAGAALAHVALDFPLHVDDGHTHFWPISNWKFISAISYWDPRFYGNWVRPVEFAIGFICLIVIFRRFQARWVKALTIFGMAAYVIEPLFFFLSMGTGN